MTCSLQLILNFVLRTQCLRFKNETRFLKILTDEPDELKNLCRQICPEKCWAIHKGEKPFKCTVCNHPFRTRFQMIKHVCRINRRDENMLEDDNRLLSEA